MPGKVTESNGSESKGNNNGIKKKVSNLKLVLKYNFILLFKMSDQDRHFIVVSDDSKYRLNPIFYKFVMGIVNKPTDTLHFVSKRSIYRDTITKQRPKQMTKFVMKSDRSRISLCAILGIVPWNEKAVQDEMEKDEIVQDEMEQDEIKNNQDKFTRTLKIKTKNMIVQVKTVHNFYNQIMYLQTMNGQMHEFELEDSKKPSYRTEVNVHHFNFDLTSVFKKESQNVVRKTFAMDKSKMDQSTFPVRNLFGVENILTADECKWLTNYATNDDNFWQEIKREYPKEHRQGRRALVMNQTIADCIWQRLKPHFLSQDVAKIKPVGFGTMGDWRPVAVNPMLRFVESPEGGHFSAHQDAGYCASNDLRSIFSIVIYLNQDFSGGSTSFYNDGQDAKDQKAIVDIKPEQGMAVVFNHSIHHAGNVVTKGTKVVLRADVMFQRTDTETTASKLAVATDPKYYLVRHLYRKCVVAAQEHRPEDSTKTFQEITRALVFSHDTRTLEMDKKSIGFNFLKIWTSAMIHKIATFLTVSDVTGSLMLLSSPFARMSYDSSLWLKLYKIRWPDIYDAEKHMVTLQDRDPALTPYRNVFSNRWVLDKNLVRSTRQLVICLDDDHVRFQTFDNENDKSVGVFVNQISDSDKFDQDDVWGYQLNEVMYAFQDPEATETYQWLTVCDDGNKNDFADRWALFFRKIHQNPFKILITSNCERDADFKRTDATKLENIVKTIFFSVDVQIVHSAALCALIANESESCTVLSDHSISTIENGQVLSCVPIEYWRKISTSCIVVSSSDSKFVQAIQEKFGKTTEIIVCKESALDALMGGVLMLKAIGHWPSKTRSHFNMKYDSDSDSDLF